MRIIIIMVFVIIAPKYLKSKIFSLFPNIIKERTTVNSVPNYLPTFMGYADGDFLNWSSDTSAPVKCVIPDPNSTRIAITTEPKISLETILPEGCGRPRIMSFETNVDSSLTSDVTMDLRIAGDAFNEVLIRDAGTNIRFFDAQVSQFIADGSPLRIGTTGGEMPPTGPIADMFYLIGSQADQMSDGKYRLTVKLETAYSRKVVQKASAIVNHHREGLDAMRKLALQFLPLREIIKSFELRVREQDPNVAIYIGFDGIRLTPLRNILGPGEKTLLNLTLIDCDGTALRGRKVKLSAQKGFVEPSEVFTDETGRATISYQAPGQLLDMQDLVTAKFEYMTPYGRPDGYMETNTVINLKSQLWSMEVQVLDTSISINNQPPEYSRDETVRVLRMKSLMVRTKTGANEIDLIPINEEQIRSYGEMHINNQASGEDYWFRSTGLSTGLSITGQIARFSYTLAQGAEKLFIQWPNLGKTRFSITSTSCGSGGCETNHESGEIPQEALSLVNQFQFIAFGPTKIGKPPILFIREDNCGYLFEDRQVTELEGGKIRILHIRVKVRLI